MVLINIDFFAATILFCTYYFYFEKYLSGSNLVPTVVDTTGTIL